MVVIWRDPDLLSAREIERRPNYGPFLFFRFLTMVLSFSCHFPVVEEEWSGERAPVKTCSASLTLPGTVSEDIRMLCRGHQLGKVVITILSRS